MASESSRPAGLDAGAQLGPYLIEGVLGSGGMGTVYRARDERLERDVAIKVLREESLADAEQSARFQREARLLAALNHPHIAAIYGIEDGPDGRRALVLELVEGPTLAERIAKGPLPIKEALSIAMQIADALDAAHERGIVHRDLKPANIKTASNGSIKILDFGVAKLVSGSPATSPSPESADVPTTMTTGKHTIVGTVAYMSPEQTRGVEVDKRTDIWSFGCVLYEMLTGRAAFQGPTVSDVLAAILSRDLDFASLPASIPAPMRRLLSRCLEKERNQRLRDIADARMEIEDALTVSKPEAARVEDRGHRTWIVWSAVAVAAFAGIVIGWFAKPRSGPSSQAGVTRFVIAPLESLTQTSATGGACAITGCGGMTIALSPDGRRIAYVGYINGRQQIYIRDINSFESRPIPGTDGAHTPAFSPDGRSLAFIVDRKLKRVSLDGGTPQVLSELVEGIGLSWSADDTILFNPGLAIGIWRVSANGGRPMEVTRIESKDTQHRFPEMLPNGKGLLFSTTSGVADPNIYVHSFETGRRRFLVNGVAPHYLPTGHLTFVQGLTLFAVPFDLEKLVTTGAPVAVLQNIRTSGDTPLIAFSGAGSMIYLPATGETRDLSIAWVAHDGTEQSLFASGRDIAQPRIAPDGRRVAVTVRAPSDLWSFDLMRETWSRLTYDGQSSFPIWTPDGRRLTFASAKAGPTNIFWKSPDGGESSEEQMNVADYAELPLSWSPDGRTLAYVRVDPGTQQDIWTLNLESGGKPQPFLQTRFREGAPQFSPDGRWLAYVSDESGQNEVYVRPFPGPGDKWTVSSEGGNEPIWPRNAQQLFYRKGNAMMAVDVSTSPTFTARKPRQLFEKPYERSNAYWPNYDVTPDGKRFLMVKAAEQLPPPSQVYVVLNWSDELKQRVPAK